MKECLRLVDETCVVVNDNATCYRMSRCSVIDEELTASMPQGPEAETLRRFKLAAHSLVGHPRIKVAFDKRSNDRPEEEVDMEAFIAVKGVKAIGNRLTPYKVKDLELLDPVFIPMTPELEEVQGMLITEDEIGNMEAPEEEDLEESPMGRIKRAQAQASMEQERHPDDPLIGKSPGRQTTLGLD